MKKRYFPKKFKFPNMGNLRRKTQARLVKDSTNQKRCISLRDEFDIIIRENYTLLSDDQIDRLWKQIGTQILQAPNLTLKEHIDNLII